LAGLEGIADNSSVLLESSAVYGYSGKIAGISSGPFQYVGYCSFLRSFIKLGNKAQITAGAWFQTPD
jgi:hypothetical protein